MGNCNYLFVLISLAFIFSSGIHIFSRGFLLTRNAQLEKRNCDKFFITINRDSCLSNDKKTCSGEKIQDLIKNVNSTTEKLCLARKSKVVILLVDALKYDFGIYDENLTNPLPYQNKLPIIHELIQNYPDNSRLLKFLADPPTTTLQRLKGMTTGSLPTFVDMGSNFATPEINEDNVIDQIYSYNLTTIFMGDSTWTELFPKKFKRKFAYPSFNIHDLDFVDNAIMKHLPNELRKNDWDLLIAHFLGVDHCGHKHGPLHQEMGRKLSEMNEVIKQLVKTMDSDTLLLVIGDHGMTMSGDHGGASKDETEALLFAYSKTTKFIPTFYDGNVNFIQQIDLAPTLSTILGFPVPFSNLGTTSLQLLPDVQIKGLLTHQVLLFHLWHNARQIRNYFDTYSKENENTFTPGDLIDFETKFEVFEHRVNSIKTDGAFVNFANDLKTHLDHILEVCRSIWIKFNPQLMTQGMLITFGGVFSAFIIIFNVPLNEFPDVFNKNIVIASTAMTVAGGLFGYFFHNKIGWDDKILSALFTSSAGNLSILGHAIIRNWLSISDQMISAKKMKSIVPRFSFIFSILVFYSNSFVIQEQRILVYLLTAQVVYATYRLRRTTNVLDTKGKTRIIATIRSPFLMVVVVSFAIFCLLRMSHSFFQCREEQENCWDLMSNSKTESKEMNKLDLISVLPLALFVALSRIFLKSSGNLTGYSLHVLVAKFIPTLAVCSTSIHLVLSQKQFTKSMIPQLHLDMLAWIVYGVFALHFLVLLINPLLIHIVPQSRNDQFRVSNHGNVIPELFRQVKNIFNSERRANSSLIPIIYGLSTVYSSTFVAFGTTLSIVLTLLLGVKASSGLLIIVAVAIGVLFIHSVLRYESTGNVKECLQPHFSLVVTWFLLVNYGFYATSHQPTISQINWNAAFVGRTANFDHSNIISAVLVLLNTFNSNILLLTFYPMLVLFPFMVYAIFPRLTRKIYTSDKKEKEGKSSEYRKITLLDPDEEDFRSIDHTDFDVTRGEIYLLENEKLFMASVFKVGCQLMILQGVKVLSSMIACTVLCRHLMVWKIFAPRFIYEGISSYISFIAIILGFVFIIRVHSSVKSLVDKINKKS